MFRIVPRDGVGSTIRRCRLAALVLWSAPALAVEVAPLVPRILARIGLAYRINRVRRLIDRGRQCEAERVLRVLRRQVDALGLVCSDAGP